MKSRRAIRLTLALLTAALLSRGTYAQSSDSGQTLEDLRKQLNDLREQMERLQARIDEFQSSKAPSTTPPTSDPSAQQEGTIHTTHPHPQAAPSPHIGTATATYKEFSEDAAAAPRFDNVPLDRTYQGFFFLPGTKTMLKIGGFFKTDFIQDLKPAGNTAEFVPSSFPVPQVAGVYNSNVSIQPTRLSLDFRIPSTKIGEVRFYVEGDMFGSSDTTPRLRHAYAQAKNILVGQTFSNFMDPDDRPDTLDFQGPNGMVNLRNPQLRYGFALSPTTEFYIALEKPTSDVAFKTPQFSSQPNSPAPDGTVRLRQEFERGHVQVAGLFRSIAAFLPNGTTGSVFGWGINLSSVARVNARDNLLFGIAAGHGISRYIQDTSGLSVDAEVTLVPTPHLQATPVIGVYSAYQHYWTRTLRSNVVYSYAAVTNTDDAPSTTYNHATYTATNLIWNPYGSLNIGGEFLYGWTMLQDGKKANDPRIQFSAKYSFVKVDSNR